jgi:broad specificity phosphatase PhoE
VIVLVRHGETEWSRDKRHTGRSDVPLTQPGREQALYAGRRLAARSFALILVSPLSRARDTLELTGLAGPVDVDENLVEWDYGEYEGRTTEDIRAERPGWEIWFDGTPGGEPLASLGARADRVIDRVLGVEGDVAIVGHGHMLRVLGARWIGLEPIGGAYLALDTAAICELGFERERRVIWTWNLTRDA